MRPYRLPSFERKQSNSSYVSTSLNVPVNYRVSFNKNDLGSINSKKEFGDMKYNGSNSNSNTNNTNKQMEVYNEIYKLKQLNYEKEKELNEVNSQYRKTIDYFNKRYNNLSENKKKYEILKQSNANMKKIILKLMQIKNK